MKRSIAWGIGSTLVAAAIIAACGNSVSDTSGSGGNGSGGKGTPSSSSSATTGGTGGSGGTVGTGGAGGSGMGGGDACTKACAHAAGCNEDICSQFPLDCSNSQDVCIAGCLNDASCDDIMTAVNFLATMMGNPGPAGLCVIGCVQQGTGGGGQGGNGAGGASAMACEQCAGNACQGPIGACAGDQACQGWFNCAMGCGFNDAACLTGCDQNNQGAATDYDAIYACACTNCATECASVDPCSRGSASTSAGTGP